MSDRDAAGGLWAGPPSLSAGRYGAAVRRTWHRWAPGTLFFSPCTPCCSDHLDSSCLSPTPSFAISLATGPVPRRRGTTAGLLVHRPLADCLPWHFAIVVAGSRARSLGYFLPFLSSAPASTPTPMPCLVAAVSYWSANPAPRWRCICAVPECQGRLAAPPIRLQRARGHAAR